ncbi:hypothetical protein [Natrinema sp. H-ect4]|uniref:hypothetical protein n=1 Tax=Natrinema sp. H-ect4 TaxID=3242699 RepID=UPI0035A8277A
MKKNPRGYPDEIELKVEDTVGPYSDENSFNTADQQNVAHDLRDGWPILFQDLAEDKDYSRQMVPNVLEDYFGPVDDDITFGEIEEQYGGYDQYRARRQEGIGQIDLPKGMDLTKRELDIAVKMMQDGFEDGFDKGFDKGQDKGREEGYDEGYKDALKEHGLEDRAEQTELSRT